MIKAILLSGGVGTRLSSDMPKQYIKVNNRMIIDYSLKTLLAAKCIDELVIVADDGWQPAVLDAVKESANADKFKGFAAPGRTRQLSIYNGMKLYEDAKENDLILIHDAARPNISCELLDTMAKCITGHDGVMPVIPMKDTVYLTGEDGRVASLVNRKLVVAGQAPEMFRYKAYLKANDKLIADGRMELINGSTEPAVLAGMDVITIPGDENNYKITTKADLDKFRAVRENA